jgi:ABC-type proline/glycine betaine transport system substrate-binding protein
MALTACSGGSSFSGGTSGSGGSANSGGAGISIKSAEFPWSAAKLTNVILTEVATQHPELGVSKIDATTLGPAPAWAGAQRGDHHPHWVFAEFQMTQLQEPTPYTPDCFTTGNGACAMPAYSAWTAAGTTVQQDAPKFYAMLQKFEIPVSDMEGMLKSVDVDKKDAAVVAKEWLGANPQKVQGWLATT